MPNVQGIKNATQQTSNKLHDNKTLQKHMLGAHSLTMVELAAMIAVVILLYWKDKPSLKNKWVLISLTILFVVMTIW